MALLLVSSAHAVLFKDTADPAYNTNAPTGALTNSGWQFQGTWNTSDGNYLGTPIAPTFFIAAKHVGGVTGAVFALNGFNYHTVRNTDCPGTDLRVWQVAETFPSYAPLSTNTNEVGQHCVVFGRGRLRGEPVIVGGETNGWRWGGYDGLQRWGENDVASISNDLLRCAFDRTGGSNECHLAVGDSSGAMFIQDGATWKLAGIHSTVDAHFSTDGTTNTQFDAALLDMGGLYNGAGPGWTFITNTVADIPSAFYSSRIATHLDWINSVINFQPGNDLGITGIAITNATDIQLTLITGSNRLYRVDRATDLRLGDWQPLTNNVTGTGSSVTVIDPGIVTNASRRFYRAVLLQ